MNDQAVETVQNITQHVGTGRILLVRSHGNLHLSDLSFTYPLKLVAPKASRQCQSVFILSYGGGLVGGDAINLQVELGRDTAIALMTQGSTKIFKQRPGLPSTKQTMSVHVHEGATCLLIPDPVQPFAQSSYMQDQRFHLHENASLVVLDWVVSGRPANGECWDFEHFTSANYIYSISSEAGVSSRLLSRDCQIMNHPVTKHQMGGYNCLATLLFTGPRTEPASVNILRRFKQEERVRGHSVSKIQHHDVDKVIWTVTRHRNVTILKAVGRSSEQVKDFLNLIVTDLSWRQEFGSDAFRSLD